MGLLNKITRFASSPQGRRAMNSATGGGTTGRRTRTTRRGAPATSGGGGLGRLVGGLLGGRRR